MNKEDSITNKEALEKLKNAYKEIFIDIVSNRLDYMFLSSDKKNPESLKYLYKALSIKVSDDKINEIATRIENGNERIDEKI